LADRRPTILQIVPELDTGGAEMSTLEISEALIAAGGRAIVLSEGGRLVARLEAMGADVRLCPAATKNPVRMVDNARRIARMCARTVSISCTRAVARRLGAHSGHRAQRDARLSPPIMGDTPRTRQSKNSTTASWFVDGW
jgi:hypothetical protein